MRAFSWSLTPTTKHFKQRNIMLPIVSQPVATKTAPKVDISTNVLRKARRSAARKKALAACLQCKSKRARCSGFKPCARCSESGRGDACFFMESKGECAASSSVSFAQPAIEDWVAVGPNSFGFADVQKPIEDGLSTCSAPSPSLPALDFDMYRCGSSDEALAQGEWMDAALHHGLNNVVDMNFEAAECWRPHGGDHEELPDWDGPSVAWREADPFHWGRQPIICGFSAS
mmetsp:Transcript_3497/g.10078  ORF Transcript_3497/g.10078 Transcript_3497/m.10078 type:complete len:230 (+) Transcript_3497:2-691(+)